ncbi:MAG: glycosyltransferase family 4 protein [Bacteroidaceae bacterium]|nr:glycosyltransferase family 4 protein [Bacteroidaceae bacterium]
MKILYVIEHISAVGGLERILIEKMNAFASEPAYEVMLMTVWREQNGPAFPLDARVGQVCLGLEKPTSSIGLVAAIPRVLSIYNKKVRAIAPDVVIHFRAMGAMLTAFSSWHGYTVFEAHTARPFSNHRWLYTFMERRADVVVCLTEKDACNYTRAKRVEVIPNFVELSDLQKSQSGNDNRKEKKAVFVGRLCQEKDPLRLLRLWKAIVAKHPDWQLEIFGKGELEDIVRAEIVSLAIADSVVLHGYASNMAEIYGSADMLLLCSQTEGMPMVLIEAMCYALPVVSTDCRYGPSDIIDNGETGFLVSQNDDEAFVDAVSALMSDKGLRERMGEKAKMESVRFSKGVIVERWRKLFLEG